MFHHDRIGRFKSRADKAAVLGKIEQHLDGVYCFDGEETYFYDAKSEDDMDVLERELTDARKENRRRTRKIKAGQRKARLQGRYTTGRIPYTVRWNKERGEFYWDEPEKQTLLAAVRLIREGYSTGQVADILNGSKEFVPPRHAPRWTDALVLKRLRADFHFTGLIKSPTHGTELDTGLKLFDKAEIMEVRELMKANRKIRKKGGKKALPKSDFFLYRLVQCTCGWKLMAIGYTIQGKEYRYYRCKKCGHGFRAEELERAVWQHFLTVYGDKFGLAEKIIHQEYVPLGDETAAAWHARRKTAEQELMEVEQSRKEIQVERFTKRRMQTDTYNVIMKELERKEAEARLTLEQAEKALMQPGILQEAVNRAVNAMASYVDWVASLEQVIEMYAWAEKYEPAMVKEFAKLAKRGQDYLTDLEADIGRLSNNATARSFILEQKRRILAAQVVKGSPISVSRDRVISFEVVASNDFNVSTDWLMPAKGNRRQAERTESEGYLGSFVLD